ncbi:MAG: aminotransferase class V-fold PLP-dependent enzyme [Planctomycetota bacterium]|nr:aminotransferase class V-fold PLP-dependent enzyme [Planctomycetota bacterium]
MTTTHAVPDLDAIRERFPALAQETIFLENAGGSQMPGEVADVMHAYTRKTFVQLGAPYALSEHCGQVVQQAHDDARLLVNGDGCGEVVLGPSTSMLLRMLADSYADVIEQGDEIVIAESGHEANVGPWLRLERQGARIRWWRVDPETGSSPLEGLHEVLSERTKIVALPHVSNLVGEVVDLAAVTKAAHDVGARVVADGVAFAPHRAVDVEAWGVDWYVYSTYKVFGPHAAVMFGRHDAFAELVGPNHFFVPDDAVPYKWELGGVSHEAAAGIAALRGYLQFLAGRDTYDRDTVTRAFEVMERHEMPLQERLVAWAQEHPQLRLIGSAGAGRERVATVSVVHATKSSQSLSLVANRENIGIRFGHMYAHRLCTALGLRPVDGVLRVSAVHYNSPAEIERLIDVLEPAL